MKTPEHDYPRAMGVFGPMRMESITGWELVDGRDCELFQSCLINVLPVMSSYDQEF